MMPDAPMSSIDRRRFITFAGALTAMLPALARAQQQEPRVTVDMIAQAERIAGLEFTPEEREEMVRGLDQNARAWEALHEVALPNAVPPAVQFDPVLPSVAVPVGPDVVRPSQPHEVTRPANLEEVAFWPVTELAELIRTRQVTPGELTRMYLARLKQHGPRLEAVVSLTEERALEQAARMDAELARGVYRGPLHGIPWGAKDLLAVTGYPTTWGAAPFRDQMFAEDATVVKRLDAAGAVLIAKLTLGELAQGDRWYGGRTRNPWNLEQGSSGSSAGPASATAAGCVGFSIGSETLGSISSPSTRCGVTGLRPTFGRVPRTGAMALSWSMDKLGPMCRTVEDCALVLAAIQGPDGADQSVHRAAFNWRGSAGARGLRVGYVQSAFERTVEDGHTTKPFDDAVLEVLRTLGVELVPVEIPDLDYNAMRIILTAEAGAAFDELTRSGRDEELAQQGPGAWPNTFRTSRLIPAVDYVNANRVRTLAIAAWDELMRDIDVIVAPTSSGQLTATNLTGHPAVILPNGFRENGTPVSITFLGRLFGEETLLRVAEAYQQATPHHLRHPELG